MPIGKRIGLTFVLKIPVKVVLRHFLIFVTVLR